MLRSLRGSGLMMPKPLRELGIWVSKIKHTINGVEIGDSFLKRKYDLLQ